MTVPASQRGPCSQCGKNNAIRPARLCPTCKRINKKASQAKAHDLSVQKKYGLSSGDYDRLLEASGGNCYICKNGGGRRRLAVDHDHQTGEVRGLLCVSCNHYLLGKVAHDDLQRLQDIMEAAILYLSHPPARTILGGVKTSED